MDLKKKIIKDVESYFDSGKPVIELHLTKLLMWYSKCEVDLMELSHNNHNDFKYIITEIVDVIISDFKRCYEMVSSESGKRFIIRRGETFNKNMRFNELLTISDFDLLMDALDTNYRKHISEFNNPNIKQSMHKLNNLQENILLNTQDIFEKNRNDNFINKRKLFLNDVFPEIEELYRKYPNEFEKISIDIHSIMFKQEILHITSYLENQDFKALQDYKNDLLNLLRPKYVSLENSGNLRLCRFLTEYERSVQNWMDGKNGSQAILKNINKDKGNCYIATMVYGDYDHPNVLELRNYRDNSLKKTYLGKKFIKLYYQISPIIVQKIKHKKLLNYLIKFLLDKIVYKLKTKKKE